MKEAVENLIQEVISLTSLSISPGCGSDDCELGWSGRRVDGIPENFFAQARICGNELVSVSSLK